ncbi:SNF1-interacting protein, partial [Rhizoclosmatium hyalinum]
MQSMVPSDRVQEMIQEARREVGCLSGKVKEGVAVWKAEVDRLYKEIDRLRAEKRQMIPNEEVHDMIEEARREREEELKFEQRALEVIPPAVNPNPSDLELKYLSLTRRHESLEASHNSLKVGYEKELNAHKAEDLTENLTYPLQHYLREEIKELREHRKNHDRVTANYDAALVKYSQLPKNKESSALTEDSFILFEAKKAYIHSNLNYADHVISFKNKMIYFFVQQLMLGMYTHMDYFENNYEVFHGMKASMDNLKIRIEERKRALPTQDEIISYKNALEEEALSIARPRLEDKAPGSRSESPNANLKESPPNKAGSGNGRVPPLKEAAVLPSSLTLPGAALSPQQPIEIEGYLFKKNEKKVWIRRYFMIKKGSMFYANTYPTGKMRGVVLSTDSLNLALFSVRVDTVEDRRFVFEVYAGKKSYKLQAESERDMHDWINVFEAAKAAALKPSAVSLPLPAEVRLANANTSQASMATLVKQIKAQPGPSALAGEEEVDEIMSENKTHVIHENSDDDEHEPEDDDDDEQDESAIHMEEVGGDTAATESGKAVAVFAD